MPPGTARKSTVPPCAIEFATTIVADAESGGRHHRRSRSCPRMRGDVLDKTRFRQIATSDPGAAGEWRRRNAVGEPRTVAERCRHTRDCGTDVDHEPVE